MKITAQRYHDISCGHRVCGHENKCSHLHGHNYRIHFKIAMLAGLDHLGRVVDFGVIKKLFCEWLEQEWDHKFLVWSKDEAVKYIALMVDTHACVDSKERSLLSESLIFVPFNPTAENMAKYLVEVIGPSLLQEAGLTSRVFLEEVTIEETAKCSATYNARSL